MLRAVIIYHRMLRQQAFQPLADKVGTGGQCLSYKVSRRYWWHTLAVQYFYANATYPCGSHQHLASPTTHF